MEIPVSAYKYFVFIFLLALINMMCFTCIPPGTISLTMQVFAVDSMHRLYLGKETKIEVLEGDVIVKTISPKTSRGYAFTITENDTILLDNGAYIYTLDLDGNELSKKPWNASIDNNTWIFNAKDGTKYKLSSPFWRYQINHITEGGVKTVYKMPLFDYVIKLFDIFSFMCFIILALKIFIVIHFPYILKKKK